jgi:hypothetical protein
MAARNGARNKIWLYDPTIVEAIIRINDRTTIPIKKMQNKNHENLSSQHKSDAYERSLATVPRKV